MNSIKLELITSDSSKEIEFNDLKGHKFILYFYPKASTPG